MLFIAVNTIQAPPEHREAMMGRFRQNTPDLKKFAGFVGFEMWVDEEGKLLAVSKWESREHFNQYIHSDAFRSHHGGQSAAQAEHRPQAQVSYYEAETMA